MPTPTNTGPRAHIQSRRDPLPATLPGSVLSLVLGGASSLTAGCAAAEARLGKSGSSRLARDLRGSESCAEGRDAGLRAVGAWPRAGASVAGHIAGLRVWRTAGLSSRVPGPSSRMFRVCRRYRQHSKWPCCAVGLPRGWNLDGFRPLEGSCCFWTSLTARRSESTPRRSCLVLRPWKMLSMPAGEGPAGDSSQSLTLGIKRPRSSAGMHVAKEAGCGIFFQRKM